MCVYITFQKNNFKRYSPHFGRKNKEQRCLLLGAVGYDQEQGFTLFLAIGQDEFYDVA